VCSTAFPLGAAWPLLVGAEVRTDRIDDLGFYHNVRGRRISTTSLADVRETKRAGYAELRWQPVERLPLTGGGRIDHYRFRALALIGAATSGATSDTIITPKTGAAFTLARGVAPTPITAKASTRTTRAGCSPQPTRCRGWCAAQATRSGPESSDVR